MKRSNRMCGWRLVAFLLLAALMGPVGAALAQGESPAILAAAAMPTPMSTHAGTVADVVFDQAKYDAILATLPDDLDIARVMLVLRAYALVDKVPYRFGGKSDSIGWDMNWILLPSAQNTPSSGVKSTPVPMGDVGNKDSGSGLDCSGFVRWCFINAACSRSFGAKIGRDTEHQWENSIDITLDELLPGDLVFRQDADGTHQNVGIVVSCGDKGANVIYCGLNGVRLNALRDTSLTIPRRPLLLIGDGLNEFHSRMEKRAERPAMRDYLAIVQARKRSTETGQ